MVSACDSHNGHEPLHALSGHLEGPLRRRADRRRPRGYRLRTGKGVCLLLFRSEGRPVLKAIQGLASLRAAEPAHDVLGDLRARDGELIEPADSLLSESLLPRLEHGNPSCGGILCSEDRAHDDSIEGVGLRPKEHRRGRCGRGDLLLAGVVADVRHALRPPNLHVNDGGRHDRDDLHVFEGRREGQEAGWNSWRPRRQEAATPSAADS
mmetsp:Transcript_92808/g.199035  ORF Transcript_92808/g.199035 Transcript_92808/m.199035 type:complete len:209 (+) Transcript_92808:613-1239(+)